MIRFPRRYLASRFTFIFAVGLGITLLFWPPRRLRSQNVVFYLPNQHKLIPTETINNATYLPVLPVLNLIGQVGGVEEKRNSLKVWFGADRLQFHARRNRVQINKTSVHLAHPVLRIDGQWMAPIDFLSAALPLLTSESVLYQAGTHRVFIGNVHPVSFSVRLEKEPSGARLSVQFTGKIAMQTASTNAKWIILLGGAVVEPMEQEVQFQNPYLKELQFDDHDGRPKLILTPALPGLDFYARLENGQQTLVADFVKPASAKSQPAPPSQRTVSKAPPAAAAVGKPPASSAPVAAAPITPALPAVVLDAGHGGADSGARSRDGILEKNLAAQIVQRVSGALEASKKYRVILTRSGDSDPSFEQRTVAANTARPAAFLTFHAGELGDRSPVIAVYTYEPSSPPAAADATPRSSLFIPWDWAQESEETRSSQLAQVLQQRFAQITGIIAPQPALAPARQLRSVAAPAVALEVGTLSPSEDAGELTQAHFQQPVADAIVAALEQFVGGGAKP